MDGLSKDWRPSRLLDWVCRKFGIRCRWPQSHSVFCSVRVPRFQTFPRQQFSSATLWSSLFLGHLMLIMKCMHWESSWRLIRADVYLGECQTRSLGRGGPDSFDSYAGFRRRVEPSPLTQASSLTTRVPARLITINKPVSKCPYTSEAIKPRFTNKKRLLVGCCHDYWPDKSLDNWNGCNSSSLWSSDMLVRVCFC